MQRSRASRRRVAWALVLLLGCVDARAQIFVGNDVSGAVVLSNFASEGMSAIVVAAEPAPRAEAASIVLKTPTLRAPASYEAAIREVARKHALPASLITAVIAVESNFDARAVSRKGAKGLMQLMPDTARRFGVRDAFAAEQNLDGGAAYLRELLHLFEGNTSLALAAYNAGEGAVLRAGRRVPAYPETQQYVAKVLAYAGRLPIARAATP